MTPHRSPIRLPALLAALLPLAVSACDASPAEPGAQRGSEGEARAATERSSDRGVLVRIGGARVVAERARTFEEKARGLSGRETLPWGAGMLFEYDEPGFYGFWMRDMRFALDLVWIRDGRIIDIHHRVPPPARPEPESPGSPPGENALPTYRPSELADTVLEVPAGYAEASRWRPGDRVIVEPAGR